MTTTLLSRAATAAALALLAACTPPAPEGGPSPRPGPGPGPAASGTPGVDPPIRNALPPVPASTGPLRVSVMYPPENAVVAADSTFVFGSVGAGGATLTINRTPVEVAPNGAFLAFLPVPGNGEYDVAARLGAERTGLVRRVRVPERGGRGAVTGIAAGSIAPRAAMTVQEGEMVTVRFRGAPGGQARLVFPDGSSIPLVEQRVTERAEGFMQDQAVRARETTEYTGTFAARAPLLSRDRSVGVPRLVETTRAGTATVELVAGSDTVRAPLELSLAVLRAGEVRTGTAVSTRVDSVVIGTAVAGGNTPYHWSFPNGTRFTVTGERGNELRVRLTDDLSIWVPADQVRLAAAGGGAVAGSVGTVRVDPEPAYVDVRLATSDRFPFEVQADERWLTVNVYGAQSRTNWLHYGTEDPLVHRVTWSQPREDVYSVRVELTERVWGWKTFWDARGNLVLRVRRPPRLDGRTPLAGLKIGVDAGHPPGGAIGPTGLTEAEANLAISKQLVGMLRDAGAEVLETRPDMAAVDLNLRPARAAAENVHLLVSVHNNAFPDGVNPFENNGTTVFYNQAPSLQLARHMQRELLRELGLRDLGIARADLALVRGTWMPAVLTETMFLMIPQQEAALRDPAVHERIARAHFRAIEGFLREWASSR
ncbi:MAG TPA: N-acetylmuramoyl-L-alanine amidase [Longimicrobium sp.]|nr:N-acetylmuramoyl-L-alanine amidase [Longimicrobium sp.]